LNENARDRILNPPPGSALARARDYGIDLTLIAENIHLTPQQLLDKAARAQILLRTLREIREKTPPPQ
jgi:hypothetical protein